MTVVWNDVYCSYCGNKSHEHGGPFCTKCGHELSPRRNLTCSKCGQAVYAEDNFCGWCGCNLREALPNTPGYCNKCGEQLHLDARFCYKCGAPAPNKRGAQASDSAETTLYGMPPIQDMRLVYAPPDFFKRGR